MCHLIVNMLLLCCSLWFHDLVSVVEVNFHLLIVLIFISGDVTNVPVVTADELEKEIVPSDPSIDQGTDGFKQPFISIFC